MSANPMLDMMVAVEGLTTWLDEHPTNKGRNQESVTWCRISKVAEELGEAIEAWIGVTAQNPRKGKTHKVGDVQKELLDVAATALIAHEHVSKKMLGQTHASIPALYEHLVYLEKRMETVL